jgi:hypothetical protein
MQIIDDNNVALWLESHGLSLKGRKITFPNGPTYNIAVEIPTGSSRSMSLASVLGLLGHQAQFSGGLLWISTWGIWTTWSTEFGEYLVSNLRAQGGPVLPPSGQSGHLFGSGDKMLADALLWQTMLLNWDGFYIPKSAEYVVEISHDELCWVVCSSHSRSINLQAELKPWNPRMREGLG